MIRHRFLQALFELQKPGRFVPLAAVAERMGLAVGERSKAKSCAHRMLKRGWIANRQREGDGSAEAGAYRLTAAGAAALAAGAAATQPGSGAPGRGRHSRQQQRLWLAMRASRKFSVDELATILIDAGTPAAEAERFKQFVRRYVRGLVRGGYAVALRRAGAGRHLRFLLVRDTGPKPPLVRWGRLDVVDQNDGQTHAFDAHLRQAAESAQAYAMREAA